MKIILGAGKTFQEGFISTNEEELNLIDKKSFHSYFKEIETVDIFLAEHVFEHLSYDEGVLAAKLLYKYLKPNGFARIAVPDANFQNEWYHNMCKVGGPGPMDHPAYTHKIFYDYQTLISVFEEAGFVVDLLEFCDEEGRFHFNFWNSNDGKIGRSLRYDTRNYDNNLGMVSIIIDAKKPS